MVHNLMEHISMATEEKLSDKEGGCGQYSSIVGQCIGALIRGLEAG